MLPASVIRAELLTHCHIAKSSVDPIVSVRSDEGNSRFYSWRPDVIDRNDTADACYAVKIEEIDHDMVE